MGPTHPKNTQGVSPRHRDAIQSVSLKTFV